MEERGVVTLLWLMTTAASYRKKQGPWDSAIPAFDAKSVGLF